MHHLFFWMLLFGLWYFMRYEDYSTGTRAFQVTLIKVADLALMVSITNYILIPHLLYQKKYGWFILCFVVLVTTSSVLKMNILGRLLNSPQLYSLGGNLKARVYDNVIPHFFLVIAGASIKLLLDYGKLQQRLSAIAKEKAEAELNFLKSQINPHFLFNSLNSVYFLIDKENTDARDALHKFSAMLRYQLYEMNDAVIPIEKELQYLRDYVDLQKLRKDEQCKIDFHCSPSVNHFSIEPLLLIPFVENAFKHLARSADGKAFINIQLDAKEQRFSFRVDNSKNGQHEKKDIHSGIGLGNVQKRLALLYPGRHQLQINNSETVFGIQLTLQIHSA